MNNMVYQQILTALNNHCCEINFTLINHQYCGLGLPEIKTLLIQSKKINGIAYLALRNIEINTQYRHEGLCKTIIQCCIDFCIKEKIPFMIDDVVNPFLDKHLLKYKQLERILYKKEGYTRPIVAFKFIDELIYY